MHRAALTNIYLALVLSALNVALGLLGLLEWRRLGLQAAPAFLASIPFSIFILVLLFLLLRRSRNLAASRNQELEEGIEVANKALQEKNQVLTSTFESMTDGFVSLDTDWRYTYVNQKAGEMLGKQPGELLGKMIWEVFPEGVGQPFHKAYLKAMSERLPVVLEEYYQPWNRWFENRIYPFPGGIAIFFYEITERKLAERRLQKFRGLQALLNEVNQTILRVPEPHQLFEAVCRIAVEQGGFRLAWFGSIDGRTNELKSVAQAGGNGGSHDQLEQFVIRPYDSDGGFTTNAWDTQKHLIVDDIFSDPSTTAWRADAERLGLQSSATLLLRVADEPRNVLNLYAAEPGFFTDEVLEQLEKMASDIAFAMGIAEQDEQRLHTEMLLRASEIRHQTLARILPVGVFRTDINGNIIYINEKYCVIAGLSPQEVVDGGWWQAIHPDDTEALKKDWQDAIRLKKSSLSDHRFVHKDGAIIWVMGEMVPELDSEGRVMEYIGTISDISFRKQMEMILESNERQLSLIYKCISDILFYLEVEQEGQFRFLSVNSAFLNATGLAESQVIGKLVQEVIPEPAHAMVLGNYREAIRTKKTITWEEVSVYPTGKKYGEVSVNPIFDPDGRCTRLLGTVHDITERKQAEEALRISEEQLKTMIVEAPIGIALIDSLTAHIYECNPRFAEIAGRSMEEMADIDWIQLTHPEDLQADLDNMALMNAGKTSGFEMEKRYIRPDGTVVWINMTIASLTVEDRAHPRHLSMIQDITQRKRAENEIRILNTELEQRVLQRTSQLESANKELESFSYSVSHDLRAPLRAISGFASIISRRYKADLNKEGQHYLDNIIQASERMGHLIDDLLTYARLGRQSLGKGPVPLAGLMAELRRNLQNRLEAVGGRIDVAEGLPSVIGDQTLISQIFTNLLENSMTYHKPGMPPQVSVTWQTGDGHVVVQVSDNGIGISSEYWDKIFNIFQRLHSEDEYPGTGIGLATVKKSVDLLNGSVWVESKIGEGSSFFVRLPKE